MYLLTVENVIKNPREQKFRRINLENGAYKKRVGKVVGGRQLLEAIGFQEVRGGGSLELGRVAVSTLKDWVVFMEEALKEFEQ